MRYEDRFVVVLVMILFRICGIIFLFVYYLIFLLLFFMWKELSVVNFSDIKDYCKSVLRGKGLLSVLVELFVCDGIFVYYFVCCMVVVM